MSNTTSYRFEIDDTNANLRLDKALVSLLPDISRSRLKKIYEEGGVHVNQDGAHPLSKKVQVGDVIDVIVEEAKAIDHILAEDIPLDIVYEDGDLLVINKPIGLVVHPGAGHHTGTLVHALLHHCGDNLSGIGGEIRPGIVHRLDKDTSGLMLVAKNDMAHAHLSKQLETRKLSRTYTCFVWGNLKNKEDCIETQLGRSKTNRQKMAVLFDGGKEAITDYSVIKRYFNIIDVVECRLRTGRTHQIRVHMTHIGHSLLGDQTYGQGDERAIRKTKQIFRDDALYDRFHENVKNLTGQALHARKIGFIHPRSKKEMSFETDLPQEMLHILDILSENFKTQ